MLVWKILRARKKHKDQRMRTQKEQSTPSIHYSTKFHLHDDKGQP